MSMQLQRQIRSTGYAVRLFFNLALHSLLQRKCACGNHIPTGGEGEECKKNRLGLQRKATAQSEVFAIPTIVHEVLRSPGQPLDSATRAFMEVADEIAGNTRDRKGVIDLQQEQDWIKVQPVQFDAQIQLLLPTLD